MTRDAAHVLLTVSAHFAIAMQPVCNVAGIFTSTGVQGKLGCGQLSKFRVWSHAAVYSAEEWYRLRQYLAQIAVVQVPRSKHTALQLHRHLHCTCTALHYHVLLHLPRHGIAWHCRCTCTFTCIAWYCFALAAASNTVKSQRQDAALICAHHWHRHGKCMLRR